MNYEIVFILDSKNAADGGEPFVRDVVKHIEELGGEVTKRNSIGRKHFAHPVGRRRSGLYWGLMVTLAPGKVETFSERYRLDETVLRLQVFRAEEAKSKQSAVAGV